MLQEDRDSEPMIETITENMQTREKEKKEITTYSQFFPVVVLNELLGIYFLITPLPSECIYKCIF